MIIPILMVTDMDRSVAFYRDVVGLTVTMAVLPEREVVTDGSAKGAEFVTLAEGEAAQLMLQTQSSLAAELPLFAGAEVTPCGVVYFRGVDPEPVRTRCEPGSVLREIETSWYGMKELSLRDPDGHVVTLGLPV